jgi:hypothetical protein
MVRDILRCPENIITKMIILVREDVFRQKVAFEILSTRYYSSFFGTFFGVTGSVIFTNGLKYFSVSKSFNIASFQVHTRTVKIASISHLRFVVIGC